MRFEQTRIFRDLVKHFCNFANSNRFTVGREAMAAEMVARFSRVHGAANVAKVAKKANLKTKTKFYTV